MSHPSSIAGVTRNWSIGQCATMACLLEVMSPKPGNVHRGCDFEDVGLFDFAASGVAIAPAMQRLADGSKFGEQVLAAVQATREIAGNNTNLGMILLLAPLAAVPREKSLADGVKLVLANLTAEDANDVYAAIRLANPGGLGSSERNDVRGPAPTSLIEAMQLAAERDLVARQYANGFREVLEFAAPLIRESIEQDFPLPDAVVRAHLQLLAKFPDSLIARKCGQPTAQQASVFAERVLATGMPGEENYQGALADFDFWLRSDGHRRNPGTTADLIAAGLFVLLRDGWVPPMKFR